MNSNSGENNFILARSQEHKLILESLGDMEACLKFSTADELIENLKRIIETFKANLLKHQKLEELVIFSAGMQAVPTSTVTGLIIQLTREHGLFEATIDSIIDKMNFPCEGNQTRLMIQRDLERIITLIKKHSLNEVKNLFPLLSNNLKCRTLIDSLAATVQI
ncbi:MAG: hemerythrin domain-containing protein [Candidatus Riflebacteria bacterium]